MVVVRYWAVNRVLALIVITTCCVWVRTKPVHMTRNHIAKVRVKYFSWSTTHNGCHIDCTKIPWIAMNLLFWARTQQARDHHFPTGMFLRDYLKTDLFPFRLSLGTSAIDAFDRATDDMGWWLSFETVARLGLLQNHIEQFYRKKVICSLAILLGAIFTLSSISSAYCKMCINK